MKKFILGIGSFALALGLGVAASSAQVTQTAAAIESKALPADAFREKINAAVYDLTVTDIPAIITKVNELLTPQSDTNVTTVATKYTPRRVGDVLIGGKGSGTNYIAVSKGTTTNDWVQVAP